MTFSRNAKIGKQVMGLRLAMMKLGLEGYKVLKTHTDSAKEMASIEIDRPYEGEAFEVSQLAEKKVGWLVKWNIRLFWEIKE